MTAKKPDLKPRKIAYANLPMRMPVWHTIVLWLLLDRLQVSGYTWGVFWTCAFGVWFLWAYGLVVNIQVDVFEDMYFNRRHKNEE